MLFVISFVVFAFALSYSGEKTLHGDDNILRRSRDEITSSIEPALAQVRRRIGAGAEELTFALLLRYIWAIVKAVANAFRNGD